MALYHAKFRRGLGNHLKSNYHGPEEENTIRAAIEVHGGSLTHCPIYLCLPCARQRTIIHFHFPDIITVSSTALHLVSGIFLSIFFLPVYFFPSFSHQTREQPIQRHRTSGKRVIRDYKPICNSWSFSRSTPNLLELNFLPIRISLFVCYRLSQAAAAAPFHSMLVQNADCIYLHEPPHALFFLQHPLQSMLRQR
jgi:hypothetical protein